MTATRIPVIAKQTAYCSETNPNSVGAQRYRVHFMACVKLSYRI